MANPVLDFFKNKKVQDVAKGVGTAAAFGANPLLGLLAAPVIGGHRERRSLENNESRERALTSKAQRERLDASMASLDNLPHVMSQSSPLTPEGRKAELTRTAALNPGLSNSLFPTGRQTSAEEASDLEAQLGRKLTEQEALNMYGAVPQGMDPIEQARLALLMDDMKTRAEERRVAGEEADTAELEAADFLEASAGDLLTMNNSIGILEGTFLEPGSTGAEFVREFIMPGARFLADLSGRTGQGEELNKQMTAYDSLNKAAARFNGNTIRRMNSEGITVTRSLQQLIQSMNPNSGMAVGTIQAINAMMAHEILVKDSRNKLKLPEEIVSQLEQARASFQSQGHNFVTPEEAQAARDVGLIKDGDEISVGGEVGSWRD